MHKEKHGEALLILSSVFFAVNSVLVKLISSHFNGMFISMVRFAIGLVVIIPYLYFVQKNLRIIDIRSWILRGITGAVGMMLTYVSIDISSSGRATLLSSTYPVFVALFGYLFFREVITKRRILSIALCVAGAFFVFNDGSSYSIWGDIAALGSSIVSGIAIHYVRRSSRSNHPLTVYASACLFGLFALPLSLSKTYPAEPLPYVLVIVIALTALFAQAFMTGGYKHVEATKGSIISYLTIPMTLLLSLFIGEEFRPKFIVGIVFISAGLAFTVFTVHKRVGIY